MKREYHALDGDNSKPFTASLSGISLKPSTSYRLLTIPVLAIGVRQTCVECLVKPCKANITNAKI